MKFLKSLVFRFWKDESGQGTAEYVLILVAVIAVGFIFKDKITAMLESKLDGIASQIGNFNP